METFFFSERTSLPALLASNTTACANFFPSPMVEPKHRGAEKFVRDAIAFHLIDPGCGLFCQALCAELRMLMPDYLLYQECLEEALRFSSARDFHLSPSGMRIRSQVSKGSSNFLLCSSRGHFTLGS